MTPFHERILELLCNCAKSRGRHSSYCPTYTARARIVSAINQAMAEQRASQ